MKKFIIFFLLIIFIFNIEGKADIYKNLKIFPEIDLKLDSNPKASMQSLYNYNNAKCRVSFTKQNEVTPTRISFELSDNLDELYTHIERRVVTKHLSVRPPVRPPARPSVRPPEKSKMFFQKYCAK